MGGASLHALEALAAEPPRNYLERPRGGTSVLQHLYELAASAGLLPEEAVDDVARLHGLFDVALSYGMGSLVCDYIAEVCSDRLLTSSDPVEAFLLDGECVRQWASKKLAVSHGRLTGWLSSGLSSITGSRMVVPKEFSKLQVLQLVFEALAQPPQQPYMLAAVPAAPPAHELPELREAQRLAQCAHAVAWLMHQPGLFERPLGKFSSEQEWRSLATRRRNACGPLGLFLTDMVAALGQHGVPSVPYPASTTEKLLLSLFMVGQTSQEALHAKLALMSYHLLDGGFMPSDAIVDGLRHEFGVPRDTVCSWLLMQLLDGSHASEAGVVSLQQAVALAPSVNGSTLPSKAAAVFQQHMRGDVALRLLRQCRPSTAATALSEACNAVGARLANGLLVEAYIVLKEHLAAVPGTERRIHAKVLMEQLLGWASQFGCVNTIIRLHFEGEEEEALVGWLEARAKAGEPSAGLLLALYYLMRGRTPEALLAYNRLCPARPATVEQAQVLKLLAGAARMLPAPQRALVVREGDAAALLVPDAAAEDQQGTSLVARLPELATDAPRLVSVGPTLSESPLVGSVPVVVGAQYFQAPGEEAASSQAPSNVVARGGLTAAAAAAAAAAGPPLPLLFGSEAAAAGRDEAPPFHVPSVEPAAAVDSTAPERGLLAGAHEFDKVVLGVGGAGKRRRGAPVAGTCSTAP